MGVISLNRRHSTTIGSVETSLSKSSHRYTIILVTDRVSASSFISFGGKALGPTTEHFREAAATANLSERSKSLPFDQLLI